MLYTETGCLFNRRISETPPRLNIKGLVIPGKDEYGHSPNFPYQVGGGRTGNGMEKEQGSDPTDGGPSEPNNTGDHRTP